MMAGAASLTAVLVLASVVCASNANTEDGKPASQDRKPGKRGTDRGPGFEMLDFSFETTLTFDDYLGDWLSSGGSMALRDRVQLLPPVPDRHGIFMSKKAVGTFRGDFVFKFKAGAGYGKSDASGPQDGGFAFWFMDDDYASSFDEMTIVRSSNWTEGMSKNGLHFLGVKPTFRGIGIIFLGVDAKGKAKPSVSVLLGDGTKEHKLYRDVPVRSNYEGSPMWLPDGQPNFETDASATGRTTYLNWREQDVTLTLSYDPMERKTPLLCNIQLGNSKIQELFSQTPVDIKSKLPPASANWFIGFTGYSGTESFTEVNIKSLKSVNYDPSVAEEARINQALGEQSAEWVKALAEEARYVSQAEQKDAVERLSKLLSEHMTRFARDGGKARTDIANLEARLQKLQDNLGLLITETEAWDQSSTGLDKQLVEDHIVGLRKILHKDKEHDTKLEQVQQIAARIKETAADPLGTLGRQKIESAASQLTVLEDNVAAGSSQTSRMLCLMVLAVAALAVLFLNRMWYYEKKHYV